MSWRADKQAQRSYAGNRLDGAKNEASRMLNVPASSMCELAHTPNTGRHRKVADPSVLAPDSEPARGGGMPDGLSRRGACGFRGRGLAYDLSSMPLAVPPASL